MKSILFILLVFISLHVLAQKSFKQINAARANGDTICCDYQWLEKDALRMGLSDMKISTDSIHLRLWGNYNVIDIVSSAEKFTGKVLCFTDANLDPWGHFKSDSFLYDSASISTKDLSQIISLYGKLGIDSILKNEYSDWQIVNDAPINAIEKSTPIKYFFKVYTALPYASTKYTNVTALFNFVNAIPYIHEFESKFWYSHTRHYTIDKEIINKKEQKKKR